MMKVRYGYPDLRHAMIDANVSVPDIAELLGCSKANIYAKIAGRTTWMLTEMIVIADMCQSDLNIFRRVSSVRKMKPQGG